MKQEEKIINILCEIYPSARTELRHSNPLQLLIATILSAQCTDKKVNEVTKTLFKKYKTAKDFVEAKTEDLEAEIKPTGFFRNKAKSIKLVCKDIIEKFNGEVPSNINDLTSLSGVGRKTASVVLANGFNIPAIAVDTHVIRVSNRLKFVHTKDPAEIEQKLMKIIPKELWIQANHALILHGRYTCTAKNPKCGTCKIYSLCPTQGNEQ